MASWFYNKFTNKSKHSEHDSESTTAILPLKKNDLIIYIPRYIGNFIKPKINRLNKYSPSKSINSIYDSSVSTKIKKAVILDVDETIGSFTELFFIWNAIRPHDYEFTRDKTLFIDLAKLYPEVLRPGMIMILKHIHEQIRAGNCHKLHIYTNNQCTYPEWIQLLINYLDYLLHQNKEPSIFEKPICAFKINDRVIEHKRTCHSKTHSDLIKCSILPQTTEICFIDDTKFEKMINERVYYIQPPPYKHTISYEEMKSRFTSKYNTIFPTTIKKQWFIPQSNEWSSAKKELLQKHEIEISKKILYYIRDFFMMRYKPKDTKKIQIKIGKFTRKREHNKSSDRKS